MGTPKEIAIDLYNSSVGDDVIGEEFLVTDFIVWLNQIISTAPAEYRDHVLIEFDNDMDYDRPRPELRIWYRRIETATEVEWRIKRESGARRLAKERTIRQAMATLRANGYRVEEECDGGIREGRRC